MSLKWLMIVLVCSPWSGCHGNLHQGRSISVCLCPSHWKTLSPLYAPGHLLTDCFLKHCSDVYLAFLSPLHCANPKDCVTSVSVKRISFTILSCLVVWILEFRSWLIPGPRFLLAETHWRVLDYNCLVKTFSTDHKIFISGFIDWYDDLARSGGENHWIPKLLTCTIVFSSCCKAILLFTLHSFFFKYNFFTISLIAAKVCGNLLDLGGGIPGDTAGRTSAIIPNENMAGGSCKTIVASKDSFVIHFFFVF